MSTPRPVGESRADDKPWRKGAFVRAITNMPKSRRPQIVPRSMRGFPFTAPTKPRGVDPLQEISELGIDYDTDWAREPGARVIRRVLQDGLLRPTITGLTTPTVNGLDRLKHLEGPVIFAANHHSHLDTGLLLMTIPRRFREKTIIAAGADYFFTTKLQSAISALTINAVPIERTKVSRQSSDQLLALLREDWSLIIFPEGGRSPDGWGHEFKPGAAYLAERRGCPIVPVHIEGTDVAFPKGAKLPKKHHCTVTFGSAIFPNEVGNIRALSAAVEGAVAVLADEHRTDWWSARRNAAVGATPPLQGPDGVGGWRRDWAKSAAKSKRSGIAPKGEPKKRSWP